VDPKHRITLDPEPCNGCGEALAPTEPVVKVARLDPLDTPERGVVYVQGGSWLYHPLCVPRTGAWMTLDEGPVSRFRPEA
jgi:hypothetical protein